MNAGMYIELSLCNRRANHITDKQKKERTFGKDWSAQENKGLQFLSVTANEQIVLLPGDTHLSIYQCIIYTW